MLLLLVSVKLHEFTLLSCGGVTGVVAISGTQVAVWAFASSPRSGERSYGNGNAPMGRLQRYGSNPPPS